MYDSFVAIKSYIVFPIFVENDSSGTVVTSSKVCEWWLTGMPFEIYGNVEISEEGCA